MSEKRSNLDRPFISAYDRQSRSVSLIVEAVAFLLIGFLGHRGGWIGAAIAAGCGLVAGILDHRMVSRNWERFSQLTMRDVIEKGRQGVVPAQGMLRSALPLIGVAAGTAALFSETARPVWLKILLIPFLYLAWLLGRDLVLFVFPPKGR